MFTVSELKELMDKMQETNLSEIKIEANDYSLRLVGQKSEGTSEFIYRSTTTDADLKDTDYSELTASSDKAIAPPKEEGNIIRSPIVGTFYEAAAPNKPPFATRGSHVKKGDVLFVIESMKLMNEIQSEFDGVVLDINVSNGQAVEYNQPIMRIG